MRDSVQPGFCSEMQFDHAPTKAANRSFQLERFPQLLDLSVTPITGFANFCYLR
jgi:hypothetical protein